MNNIGKIQDAVLALGEFKGKPIPASFMRISVTYGEIWYCGYGEH